jgi:hypothetical protein
MAIPQGRAGADRLLDLVLPDLVVDGESKDRLEQHPL